MICVVALAAGLAVGFALLVVALSVAVVAVSAGNASDTGCK